MHEWMTGAAGLMAFVASIYCLRCARAVKDPEKFVWGSLAAGSLLTVAAEAWVALARWQGTDLKTASPGCYAAWASLDYFLFVGFYVTASMKPHLARSRPVRPALVVDALLLALLLVATHYSAVVSYRMSSGAWDRRVAGMLLILLPGLGAAAALASCRKQTRSALWKRAYARLALAVLCLAVHEGIYILLRDSAGYIARRLEAWTAAADLLEVAAFVLLGLAAAPRVRAAPAEEPAGDQTAVSVWRELSVPTLALLGVLGIPLMDGVFLSEPQFTGEMLRLRDMSFTVVMSLYVLLILMRQFLVQMENRALSLDLQQESMRLRLLVDNIHDAVITEDLNGRVGFANERFLELFGLPHPQPAPLRLDDFVHPEDRPLRRDGGAYWPSGEFGPARFEFRGVHKDGTILYLESSVAPVRVRGVVLGFQSVIRDITERRRAEERQRELAQRLEFFVTNMPLGCIVFDLEFRIVEWNNSAARIFGWSASEAFGRHGLDLLVPPEEQPGVAAVWDELQQTKSFNHRVNQNLTKDRGTIECEWFNTSLIDQGGHVVAVACMVQDVTERRSLEAQLRQSQKMEAVGVLAGGIAHDFNNLLTIILGNVSLALMRLPPQHEAARGLRDVEKAAERAAELVRQLLGFSRKGRSTPRPVSLNVCVKESVELLRRSFDPRVVIETHEEPGLWSVEADAGQMHQILVNLCVNARDAMPEGGKLSITTSNRTIAEKYCRAHPEARPGAFVEFCVCDTGKGMDASTAARIFEPFFTTKEIGKGTGLGLAMVYGIVKQHEGWITVESAPGKGSRFSIFLPRSRAAPDREIGAPSAAAANGSETILLVDDESMILNLARAILEESGHRVLEAHDGEEAIQVFRENREEIDLVLLDMIMPRLSGRDALEELHRLAPDVPVVLASGYAMAGSDELAALGARAYIQKPYHPADLARTVRHVLDGETQCDAEQFHSPLGT